MQFICRDYWAGEASRPLGLGVETATQHGGTQSKPGRTVTHLMEEEEQRSQLPPSMRDARRRWLAYSVTLPGLMLSSLVHAGPWRQAGDAAVQLSKTRQLMEGCLKSQNLNVWRAQRF